MIGTSAQDKTSFQSRRILANRGAGKVNEKETVKRKTFLPIQHIIGKGRNVSKVLVSNKKRAILTVSILAIFILAGGGFVYYQYLLSQNPAVIYSRKLKSITDTVSQQVRLPTDEQPVTATVTNVGALPKEAFFKNAEDGDKILMYKKHKEAILYRPSTGQVITIATLDFKDSVSVPVKVQVVAGASTSATVTQSVSVAPSQITPTPTSPPVTYIPQGKILIQPGQ